MMESLDAYGSEFKLKVFEKNAYKTFHGGLLTIVSAIVMAVVAYLFGRDFIYKLNPRIFSKKEVPLSPKILSPTNENFSIMWKIETSSTNLVSEENTVFYPFFIYTKWKRKPSRDWEISGMLMPAKKCSETTNKDNPNIQTLALDNWYCIDWEDVEKETGEPAKLGGQWDGEEIYTLKMDFRTCDYNTSKREVDFDSCSSLKDISDALSRSEQFFSFNLPTFNFDTTDYENPVEVYYKYVYFRASSKIALTKYFYFINETLLDDRGWILEDREITESVSFDHTTGVTRLIDENDFESSKLQTYFSVGLYFTKEDRLHYRSFIKIQELFANIGGILKLTAMAIGYLSTLISREMLEIELINKFNKKEALNAGLDRSEVIQNNHSMTQIKKKREEIKASFFKIFSYKALCCNKKFKSIVDEHKKSVIGKIDVVELINKANTERTRESITSIRPFRNR